MKYRIKIDEYYIDWFKNKQLHRLYGPASEYAEGYRLWYKNGVNYTEKE